MSLSASVAYCPAFTTLQGTLYLCTEITAVRRPAPHSAEDTWTVSPSRSTPLGEGGVKVGEGEVSGCEEWSGEMGRRESTSVCYMQE